jgi:hypothetical protein
MVHASRRGPAPEVHLVIAVSDVAGGPGQVALGREVEAGTRPLTNLGLASVRRGVGDREVASRQLSSDYWPEIIAPRLRRGAPNPARGLYGCQDRACKLGLYSPHELASDCGGWRKLSCQGATVC